MQRYQETFSIYWSLIKLFKNATVNPYHNNFQYAKNKKKTFKTVNLKGLCHWDLADFWPKLS